MKVFSGVGLVIVHVVLGLATFFQQYVLLPWILLFILYSFRRIFALRNRDGFAGIAAAYIASIDALGRMMEVGLPWEFSKYAVVGLLLAGMVSEQRRNPFPFFGLLYFLCLLPSIMVLDLPSLQAYKDELSFNLSGPLCLAVSVIYFYKRKLSLGDFKKIMLAVVLGIVATAVVVFMRMPSLASIRFAHVANFDTSGGFGPNQMSTLLGIAVLLIALAWLIRTSITGNVLVDRTIGVITLVMGILTFARGGIVVPALVLFCAILLMAFKSTNPLQFIRTIWIMGLIVVIGGGGYLFVDNLTKDALTERYEYAQVERAPSEFDEKLQIRGINLSGRESIFLADLIIFTKNPIMGVGPGGGFEAREKIGGVSIAAHTEQSRLLSEHGFYGLIALLVLIIGPYRAFISAPNLETKIVVLTLTLFCFLTMLHAAMRMAIPSFLYGLGFVVLAPTLTNPLMKAQRPVEPVRRRLV